ATPTTVTAVGTSKLPAAERLAVTCMLGKINGSSALAVIICKTTDELTTTLANPLCIGAFDVGLIALRYTKQT
ncbi:MAG: hypothetical protein PHC94_14690, partial [Methylobacter sp.]|nr:hypothetical protein [Methylobacter sp.]